MNALIMVRNAKGRVIGQCDAKCYNGTGRVCRCVCDGINHGVGLRQAAINTRNLDLSTLCPQRIAPDTPGLVLVKHKGLDDLIAPTLFDTE